jgi:hypothetical protein
MRSGVREAPLHLLQKPWVRHQGTWGGRARGRIDQVGAVGKARVVQSGAGKGGLLRAAGCAQTCCRRWCSISWLAREAQNESTRELLGARSLRCQDAGTGAAAAEGTHDKDTRTLSALEHERHIYSTDGMTRSKLLRRPGGSEESATRGRGAWGWAGERQRTRRACNESELVWRAMCTPRRTFPFGAQGLTPAGEEQTAFSLPAPCELNSPHVQVRQARLEQPCGLRGGHLWGLRWRGSEGW